MSKGWERVWRGLAWRIEYRSVGDDAGATLRIGPASQDRSAEPAPEWLRFDCFDEKPHWHLRPSGDADASEIVRPLDERADPVAESFALIEAELVPLLEQAGAPAGLTRSIALAGSDPARRQLLREAERAMRHRPTRLDELDLRRLEQRRSEKWHTYPRDVLPAWVAEMDFPIAAAIERELRRFVESSDVGYPMGLRQSGIAEAFCERMAERFDWAIEPARVEPLAEVVQGLYLAVAAYSEPGDGVVVQTPIYPPFLHAVRELDRRLVENRLVAGDGELVFDLDALARSIDAGTRLLLYCNPHNPSGHVASRAEQERLARIVLEHDLVVVADEIHADLVFAGHRHVPFASIAPEIAARTITLSSASKAFNIPGLRCAVAHFGSETLQRRFQSVVHKRFRGGLGLFGLTASVAAWRFGQPWLDEVVPHLESNRDHVERFLAEHIPAIRFHRPRATYLAWLDCEALALEPSPAAFFLQHARVALSDGRLFGSGYDTCVRLNFATSRPILDAILERMAGAVGSRRPARPDDPRGRSIPGRKA
ncbi:PatB family C-S lyase [Myxococcota bacterium]|nr:PatB family C-S lyase [Myxococcota bacterium]